MTSRLPFGGVVMNGMAANALAWALSGVHARIHPFANEILFQLRIGDGNSMQHFAQGGGIRQGLLWSLRFFRELLR